MTITGKPAPRLLKQILDETGLFSSRILTTPAKGEDMSGFSPDFSKYKLVVLDYEGDAWPEKTNAALMDFVNNGGGIVVYNSKSDPGEARPDSVTVSKRHDFEIRTRISDHPVTKGLPVRWLHPNDEIVQGLRLSGRICKFLPQPSPILHSRALERANLYWWLEIWEREGYLLL